MDLDYYDQDWSEDSHYDYNMTTVSPYEEDCQVQLGVAVGPMRAVLYSAVMAIGVPGNLALLLALCQRRRGRGNIASPWRRSCTTSEILAANLAVSDLLFLGSLPLWIDAEVSGGAWRGGSMGCKLAPYITALNMYVGVGLVTFMSIDRYLAVVFPSLFRRARRHHLVLWSCLLTWVTSALLAVPVLRSRVLLQEEPHGPSYCREPEGYRQLSPAASLCFLLFTFFLPLFITLFCYGSLIRVLCRHSSGSTPSPAPSPAPLRRSMRIVLWVVAAFIVSWLPFSVCRLLGALSRCLTPEGSAACRLRQVALIGMEWTAPLAFANSCINPLVFGAAARWLLKQHHQPACCLKACRGGLWSMTRGQTGSSTQTSPSTWDSREGGRKGE